MQELSTDILVIGSGLAGILSALEGERSGQKVLMVAKFAIGMGTNTSMANGAFAAANSNYTEEQHLHATMECGRGLSQFLPVKTLAERGSMAMEGLREYGVPLLERGNGYVVTRQEGSPQLPGVLLIRALVERLRKSSIQLLPGLSIFDLVIEGGEVLGAFGFLKNGNPCLIRSKAVVLASGGAGAVYRRNDNQRSILGDGYALALRAGLPLFDLEFVQFFPLVLAEPRLSTFILFPPYPREARMFDEKGQDILRRFGDQTDLNRAAIAERDRLSIVLYEASQSGDVYFDLTQVPEERWNRYPLTLLRRLKYPFRDRPFLIAPAVHFFMGGVEIDPEGRTALPGLFAAGEVTWGVHGANRLGGNALTECAVFGMAAGLSAAGFARERESKEGSPDAKKWERRAGSYLKGRRGGFDHPRNLLKDLKDIAWRYAGPIREEGSLKDGLERLGTLEQRIEKVYPATLDDLFRKRDLENAALVLKAILEGSLVRTESRGAFFRKDFPEQDDRNWSKNTCYRLTKGELQIIHHPLKIS
jgi:succinate dehydrogenase/fumarate reductase flavoprotein subunit